MESVKHLSRLIIASHNAGKVAEIAHLLSPLGIQVQSSAELNLEEPEETGLTFEANAALKAEIAMQAAGESCLADDSGIVVPALHGAPGIYSARWAGPSKDFAIAMRRIESNLQESGLEPTGCAASFVCVLALAIPGEDTTLFRGEAHGTLTFPPRGMNGFGYDPIFVPSAQSVPTPLTFGEMSATQKHEISHRAAAFDLFLAYLKQR